MSHQGAGNEPVPVHVVGGTVDLRQKVDVYRITFRTVVLTAGSQAAELVSGPDPQRSSMTVIANDAAAVLTGSQADASQADNLVAALPNPRGSLIPQNQVVPVPGQSEVWVTCPLTGNNINRVSVTTTHKVST